MDGLIQGGNQDIQHPISGLEGIGALGNSFPMNVTGLSSQKFLALGGETLLDPLQYQPDIKTVMDYTPGTVFKIITTVNQAIDSTKDTLTGLAKNPQIDEILGVSFGVNYNHSIADKLLNQFAQNNFTEAPHVELVSGQPFNGAYAHENNTIYLSQEFVADNFDNVDAIQEVLLEEFGHYLDYQINVQDAAGDEGDIFSRLVRGESISGEELLALEIEDDRGFLIVDGLNLGIEKNITVHEHYQFGGAQKTLSAGSYSYVGNDWNDKISSIAISQGWVIEGYEDIDFGGQKYVWDSSVSYVGNDWNDKISSLKIYQAPTIYEHDKFGGVQKTLSAGSYSYVGNDWNDKISSIYIPQGWVVEGYEHANFEGQKFVLNSSTSYVGNDWNDKISSLKVYQAQAPSGLTTSSLNLTNLQKGVYDNKKYADNSDKYLGQCVSLVKKMTGSNATTYQWKKGANIITNGNVQLGTAIATFNGSNGTSYETSNGKNKHAAIFAGYLRDKNDNIIGFEAWNQNFDPPGSGVKKSKFYTSGNYNVNSDADYYYVIQV